jgi:hypothetical protein
MGKRYHEDMAQTPKDWMSNMTPSDHRQLLPVTKVDMKAAKTDVVYWRSQPYRLRLAALESLRQEFMAWKYDVQPRFQRVYSIVKR